MRKISHALIVATVLSGVFALSSAPAGACTGISLASKDGSRIVARTCEWGGSDLQSMYVVVPRGYEQNSITPSGEDGMKITARYGYVGISVMQKEFVTEGVNEAGLSAGMFFFPGYGKYGEYVPELSRESLADVQLVAWVLSSFSTVDEVEKAIGNVHVVAIQEDAQTAHWRIADASGRQVVLEITDGVPHFHENRLGVLTNAPGFEWQMTNLNNYVNLFPGTATVKQLADSVTLKQFGAGAGFLGIPGDVTPPSRFVRAAFYKATAPQYETAFETVKEAFQILNNFDIPIGVEFEAGQVPAGVPSATQWTAVTDQTGKRFYYRTAWNSTIRCIDLNDIDFRNVAYRAEPLDKVREQPVEMLRIR